MILTQKREYEESIKNIQCEINAKHTKYEAFIKVYEKDMQQIKDKQSQMSQLLSTLNATHFNFALPIGFNKPAIGYRSSNDDLCSDYFFNLSKRMDQIELKIVNMEEAILYLNETAVSHIMQNISNVVIENVESKEVCNQPKMCNDTCIDEETFSTEMKCINDELNKMKNAILSDENAIKKMNQQLHVLSSKYITFNAKINDHLLKHNQTNHQIEIHDIVDKEALPFMAHKHQQTDHSKDFCFNNTAANRFRNKFDERYFSNFVVVRVEFAHVNNLSKFVKEMKTQFEQRTGNASVREITIIDCKTAENSLHQIDIIVHFHSQMSHGQLNNMQFPTNWTFFANTVQHMRSQYTMRHRRTYMKRTHM